MFFNKQYDIMIVGQQVLHFNKAAEPSYPHNNKACSNYYGVNGTCEP